MSKNDVHCLHCHSIIVAKQSLVSKFKVIRHLKHTKLCSACGYAESIFIKTRDAKKVVQASLDRFVKVEFE